MIGDTDVDYRNTFWTAIIDAGDDAIENSAELMRRTSVVEDQPVAVDQQTELSGVRIVGAVEPYVEVAGDIDRHLVRGDLVTNGRVRFSFVRAVDVADPLGLFGPTGELRHLKPIMDSLPAELNSDQRKAAADLLIRNADVCSKHEYDLGCTDLLLLTSILVITGQ